MSGASDNSFQAINYSLRPNKVIARKTIFEFLKKLEGTLDLGSYRYIGMGSLWFVDFLLVHRLFGIKKLCSIEADDIGYARARFNAPLGCIEVKHGYTTDILPTLNLDRQKSIVWLDHDTAIDGAARDDIPLLVDECKNGSVILITVNADVRRVRKVIKPGAPDAVTPEEVRGHLAQRLGDIVPVALTEADIGDDGYGKLIRRLLEASISASLRESGRKLQFLKLFDFTYKDGPPMATVGGLLGDEIAATRVQAEASILKWRAIISETIQAPPLTLREKMKLDQLLPSKVKLKEATFEKKSGFPLTQRQISAYVDYYSLYPTFAELQL